MNHCNNYSRLPYAERPRLGAAEANLLEQFIVKVFPTTEPQQAAALDLDVLCEHLADTFLRDCPFSLAPNKGRVWVWAWAWINIFA